MANERFPDPLLYQRMRLVNAINGESGVVSCFDLHSKRQLRRGFRLKLSELPR
ncbi:MAG: hypothetical protein IPL58_10850 [Betaproteobacteria bacterium]|uniref:Uncharacterized protein n=1 Tax=Candidatus Proximibacter danicus TaxID=2954365 RepID=A0A9D7K132_9PROT|nr:hypothetical protein [Candidatus Proximibacter danicus]